MADTLTNERLQLAADRLGGLEEIDRSTYPEFFDDAGILANAARQLLSRPTAPAEPVAWRKPEHPAATEPLFIDANLRTEEWMMGVFTVPLYAAPPASPTVSDEMAWRSMDTAPLDGKHCILAVPEPSGFIYSVQGAYQDGTWNAVHRDGVTPIAWMPNVRLPDAMRGALLAALGGHHD